MSMPEPLGDQDRAAITADVFLQWMLLLQRKKAVPSIMLAMTVGSDDQGLPIISTGLDSATTAHVLRKAADWLDRQDPERN